MNDTITEISMRPLLEAMADHEVRLSFTFAFSISGTRQGVSIEHRHGYRGRWVKYPLAIYESEIQTVADIMAMLATFRANARAGYEAYCKGEKVPQDAPDGFDVGWWQAKDSGMRFGDHESFLSAP